VKPNPAVAILQDSFWLHAAIRCGHKNWGGEAKREPERKRERELPGPSAASFRKVICTAIVHSGKS